MKKLLLAGLLVVASSAFALDTDVKPKSETIEGEIGVFAKVVSDLGISDTTNVDFGYLARRTTYTHAENPGSFTITGAKGFKVKLSAKDQANAGAPFIDITSSRVEVPVVLKNQNLSGNTASPENAKLETKLSFYHGDGEELAGDAVLNGTGLGSDTVDVEHGGYTDGKATFKVDGTVTTRDNQFNGNYKGTLVVKAQYGDWVGKPNDQPK